MQSSEIELTLDDIRLFTSGLDVSEEKDDEIVTQMLETTVKVHMLRCAEDLKVIISIMIEYMNGQHFSKIIIFFSWFNYSGLLCIIGN